MKMIEELFYGGIAPFQRPVRPGSKTDELDHLVVRNNEAMRALLTDEAQRAQFEKCYESMCELSEQLALDAFTEGFCLAAAFMAEVMQQTAAQEE